MKMYMIRHGESTANAKHLHAGWSQIPLTLQGRAEAQHAMEVIKNYTFQKVYSSDLLRAIQTKEIALPKSDVILSELLREIDVGELAGKSSYECLCQYGERYLTDKAVHDFRAYGGECREMHMNRVKQFMETAVLQKSERIAVFCHEGTIRCALMLARDVDAYKRVLKNGGVYLFEYANSEWQFKAEVDDAIPNANKEIK